MTEVSSDKAVELMNHIEDLLCLHGDKGLSMSDMDFLENMENKMADGENISDKQYTWLSDIRNKLDGS